MYVRFVLCICTFHYFTFYTYSIFPFAQQDRKETEYKEALATRDELRVIVNDETVQAEVRERVGRMLAVELPPPERVDDQPELLAKVMAGLGPEKAAQMMTVRKGKVSVQADDGFG